MIPEHFDSLTVKQLSEIAKNSGIRGWHDMRKTELISVLKNAAKKVRKSSKAKTPALSAKKSSTPAVSAKKSSIAKPKKKATESKQKSVNKQKIVLKKTATKKTIPLKPTKPSEKPKSFPSPKSTHSSPTASRKKTDAKGSVTSKLDAKNARHDKPVIPSKPALPSSLLPSKPKPKPKPKPEPFRFYEDHDAPNSRRIGLNERLTLSHDLGGVFDGEQDDRLILTTRDSYWLQAFWELNIKLIERAKAAMGVDWHTAVPILRLFRMISDGISKQRRVHVRDVKLHGQFNNWYLDVFDPPSRFFVEIGYISIKGRFFPLASSNTVETPENRDSGGIRPSDSRSPHAAFESDQVSPFRNSCRSTHIDQNDEFADRLPRLIPTAILTRFDDGPIERIKVELEVDVVIYGKTQPDVQLSIKNEPIRLLPDGRFSFRFPLPEKRQVYPIVAVSSDGIESQTTILAIERNTKSLETVFREHDEIE